MPSSILIAGPAWVGDMVMAQSLCRTLREHDSQVVLDMLAPKWSLDLIARMPEVRRGIELPTAHGELGWSKRRRVGHSLRDAGYDQAIVLPRSAKAALVPWFAGIPHRTGFLGEFRYALLNDIRTLDSSLLAQTVQRFVALGLPADAPWPPPVPQPMLRTDPQRQSTLCADLGLATHRPVVAMIPGAEYGPAKQWPSAHFGMLARRLTANGYAIWILGSAKEQALGDTIAAYAPKASHNLCGRTALVDVVDLLALCRAAVSNDSGLMHVAAAVQTPLIAIYGSSTPRFTPPLSDNARIAYRRLACSPCFERRCPLGHTHCLTGIGVGEIEAMVASDPAAVVQ